MKTPEFPLHADHQFDAELLRYGAEALEHSRVPREPVPRNEPLPLPTAMPESGVGPQAALKELAPVVLDGAAQLFHPGYFAHMDPPTPAVAWVAALWQVAANQNLLHPDAAPTARRLEERAIEWIAPFFGMRGGHLVPGSTIANFTALWAARELRGVRRVIASDKAHLSARKAADILGLDFTAVPAGPDHTMVLDSADDLADAAIVLTAGTVATGAVDRLRATGGGWVHIDGAWGGPLRFSDQHAGILAGVEAADSVGFSAHKWCYQPKGSAVVLFREPEVAHEAMSYGGGYLATPNIGLLGSAPANALPFVATLLAWGREGLAARIDAGMTLAETFAERVRSDPRLELWGEPTTGVVVWRARTKSARQLRDRLENAWVSLTEIDGQVWLRCVAANPSTDLDWVMNSIDDALEGA